MFEKNWMYIIKLFIRQPTLERNRNYDLGCVKNQIIQRFSERITTQFVGNRFFY